jgi:hypothetical protein
MGRRDNFARTANFVARSIALAAEGSHPPENHIDA